MKTSMKAVWLVCALALAVLPSAGMAAFTQQDLGTYILWSQDSTRTYFQQYKADFSWYDSTSSTGTFNYLGKLADMSTLLFDGAFHKFTDNNYSYEFWESSGMGVWQNSNTNVNQYAYDYNVGQWWNQGNWGGWATLGSAGLSTAFMGAGGGVYQSLGNNWSYLFDGNYGIWQNGNMNNVNQYAYNYETGNWYDQGNWGGWTSLGSAGLSASFMGDGTSHSVGNNWNYVFEGTYGFWNNGGMNRFAYNYDSGTWYDQSNWTGWAALSAPSVSASFVGDGTLHSLGNNWNYLFDGAYGYWQDGRANTGMAVSQYGYDYNTGQWWNQGNWGGWVALGSASASASFMGDGAWHDVGNGWQYQYQPTYLTTQTWDPSSGFWQDSNGTRFAYDYTTGAWYDMSAFNSGVWNNFGAAGFSAAFIGDGAWHDMKNGWLYDYTAAGDIAQWQYGGSLKLQYNYSTGQWSDYTSTGASWNPVGPAASSSAFIGDGTVHYLSNGWSYLYGGSCSYWLYYDKMRFEYSYNQGQWYDYSPSNGSSWSAIGTANSSSAFIGDGAWHDLNNGWWYDYTAAADTAQWKYNTNLRLQYNYATGQWSDMGPFNGTTWNVIGAANTSSAFVGDGNWHTLNNGWWYSYAAAGDTAQWKYNTNLRLQYNYTAGQWSDMGPFNGTAWSAIGAASLSTLFIGDGNWHSLGSPWSYSYASGSDTAQWKDGANLRFQYNYAGGQWSDMGPFNGVTWNAIGTPSRSSVFFGDGGWHDLGDGWSYNYVAGVGGWKDSFGDRFRYNYTQGQWSDIDANLALNPMGIAGLNSQFIGDGSLTPHDLGNGWAYRYATDIGSYYKAGVNRFSYAYDTGAWTDYATIGPAYQLGALNRSGAFIGDGQSHELGNGWFYKYVADEGLWSTVNNGPSRFSYVYAAGQWYDWDAASKYSLGPSGAAAATFIGDETWHNVTLPAGDTWWYQYSYLNDEGFWAKSSGGPDRFAYKYAQGQWLDFAPVGGAYQLGSNGMSALFIGDGSPHDLLDSTNHWRYSYDYGTDGGYWSTPTTVQARFSYDYVGGQWYQHDATTRYGLGAANMAASQFIGDGTAHDLGVWPGVSGNWWYQYASATDAGNWSRAQVEPTRFTYTYGPGQWSGGNALGFFALGNAGATPVFIGDGSAHNVTLAGGNPWWYAYDYVNDKGSWSKTDVSPFRFAYNYANSAWTDNAPIGGAYQLGTTGLSASFIGDGTAHLVDGTWKYTYDYGANEASWLKSALNLNIYSYNYDAGQWYHHDATTRYALGPGGLAASSFIGDGASHNVTLLGGDAWWYKFDGTRTGQFAQTSNGAARFGYDYPSAFWTTYGAANSSLRLGNLGLGTWVGDGVGHDLGTGWQYTYVYGADQATFSNAGYVTQFAYDYVPGQWNHSYAGTFYALGNSGNAISNSYYDGLMHTLPMGTLTEQYQFVKGNIGGATDREVGYYYGQTGTSTVGPNMAYSYYANGAADGKWALIQKSGTAYVPFTEVVTPAVNFADGNYHTTFTGQWASAKFDPAFTGKVYFELASQDPTIAKEHLYYDKSGDQWYDEWRYNNSWVTMTGGWWYGSAKFMATNLASGRQFNFAQSPTGTNPMTIYFGDMVTTSTWANMPPELLNHILFSARSFYDYTTYNWWNGPPYAWYHQTNPGPIVSPGNYYVR